MQIISRQHAIRQQLKLYFTGIPCQRNHISTRYVNNGGLIEKGYFQDYDDGKYEITINRMLWDGYEVLDRIRKG
jgi:hypothetical protein